MIGGHSDLKVVLVAGPIDFRAGINKLASLVANELGRDPYSNDVFVFRSKRMDRLKLLHFDGSGTIMVTKWLEAGKFFWPPVTTGGVIRDCQDFRVRRGIMGNKETQYVTTERTLNTERDSRSAVGRH